MKNRFLSVLLAVLLLSGSRVLLSCGEEAIPSVRVDILSIGKADCIFIQTGNALVMIDTGEEEDYFAIQSFMKRNNYTKIDTLILTHYDKDHIGCAPKILTEYEVGQVIASPIFSMSLEYVKYKRVMSSLSKQAVTGETGYCFTYDGCAFTVDFPRQESYEEDPDNNASLIVSLTCGKSRFLFCADAKEARLAEWLAENDMQYDFVKLPYHGRYLANYSDFLETVKPTHGAITCSKKNPADAAALSVLDEYGVCVYQTPKGSIHVETDGKNVTVSQ